MLFCDTTDERSSVHSVYTGTRYTHKYIFISGYYEVIIVEDENAGDSHYFLSWR